MTRDSRRVRQCHRDGCDSEAVWKMFIRFDTTTPAGHVVPVLCEHSIKVCDRHRDDAASSFISDRNMDTLAGQLAGEHLGVPRPGSIQIEFAAIPKDPCVLELRTGPVATRIIPCDRAGCILPAKTQIALKLWNIGQAKRAKPMQVLTGLCVCKRHRQECTAENVLTPEGKSRLLGRLTALGVAMPDFRSAELAFVALGEGRKADPVKFAAIGA